MEAFQNIGLKDYFKRYGFKYGMQRGLFTACPIHIVKDYENKKILYYQKIRRHLEKFYASAAFSNPEGIQYGTVKIKNPIWVYWKQGLNHAPDVVKSCVKSIKKHYTDEVIFLTERNVRQYIILPAYIEKKFSTGIMSAAAYSDLLRYSLLEHFGGTWIDATVYLTERLPEYITASNFFAYQDKFGSVDNPALMSNWLLHCSKNNIVIQETRNMTFAYWKRERYVMDYLFTYILLTFSLNRHPDIKQNMFYANSDYSYLLFNEFGNSFDQSKYDHMKELSHVHKLSYKLRDSVYRDKDNFYHKILTEE